MVVLRVCAPIFAVFLLLSAPASQATVYVNANSYGPVFDGNSWETAFRTIQEGIDKADASDDAVWVASASYVENVTLKSGVKLYGGFPPSGSDWRSRNPAQYVTTIRGTGNSSVVKCLPGVGSDTVIDGFTITGGSGTYIYPDVCGGGILCASASPTISNNIISGNSAPRGGAIYCLASSPTIAGNQIGSHQCNSSGSGAIHCKAGAPVLRDNRFTQSSAPAIYMDAANTVITRNIISGTSSGITCAAGIALISGNTMQYCNGAGIACSSYCLATIVENRIETASASGIVFENAYGSVCHNTLDRNSNSQGGGGIRCISSSPVIVNNKIVMSTSGGGIYCDSSSPTITNNTIAYNQGFAGVFILGPSSAVICNNILAFNGMPISGNTYGGTDRKITARNNLLYDTVIWQGFPVVAPGPTDVIADPQFRSGYQDYRISSLSPCIEAGWNGAPGMPATDIEGDPRIIDGDVYEGATVDIGADEYVRTREPKRFYVKAGSAFGGPGDSWENAYTNLGFSKLTEVGDEIWVARGTYTAAGLPVKPGVRIYGGFVGNEETLDQRPGFPRPVPDPNETILRGSSTSSAIVVSLGAGQNTVIDGFTITGGGGTQTQNFKIGGGICCFRAAPVIRNNTIRENSAALGSAIAGGGLIVDNIIENNISSLHGGAIYGAGVGPAAFTSITFYGKIIGNTIRRNKANSPYPAGGGIYGGQFSCINNLIANNDGPGVCMKSPEGPITNNTIVGNAGHGIRDLSQPEVGPPAGPIRVSNNICAFNQHGMFNVNGLSRNCVFGNTFNGKDTNYVGCTPVSDINLDPLLADRNAGNCRLLPGSPCVDAGAAANAPEIDLDGIVRPRDGDGDGTAAIDIGCYECPSNYVSVLQAKTLPDGSPVGISSCISTARLPGRFYVERPDRIIGIGVLGEAGSAGRYTAVEGTVTTVDGERVIDATWVAQGAVAAVPVPWFVNHNALGGGQCGLQAAVRDWRPVRKLDGQGQPYFERDIFTYGGASNIGLLVKTTGRVTHASAGGFYLDGTCVFDEGVEAITGIRVEWPFSSPLPPLDALVEITGISGCRMVHDDIQGDVVVRLLRPVSPDAVRVLE